MPVIHIDSISDPRITPFCRLTESQLRCDQAAPLFIAESPKVIRVAMSAGNLPVSMLCEERHITGDAADIIARVPDTPVYTGPRELLESITGYRLTRGVLCAFPRPEALTPQQACHGARRIAVIDDVCDTTNIGAIFRSAAALGIDAVLLGPTACDPLNRRAIRVSMGTVFLLPWARLSSADYLPELRSLGFKSVAMALRHDSVTFDSPTLAAEPHLAIILGTEGEGLPQQIIDNADYVARIPMARGVDSLNVAAASAVAFWQLHPQPN